MNNEKNASDTTSGCRGVKKKKLEVGKVWERKRKMNWN